MSDIESDYVDYERTRDQEGGLHTGRTNPSRKLLWSAVIVLVVLALGIAALALLPRE